MPLMAIRQFFRLEASGGIVLVATSAAALIFANSSLSGFYFGFLEMPVSVQVGNFDISKPLLLWINDGLMAVFFFLVGLEIKRELLEGQMSSRDQTVLPGMAAVGGMAVPALIYVALNLDDPANLNGWAIPAATDIAFALGILMLLGDRVPLSLKVLLTAIAIFDDLGAIVIIALFYTDQISLQSLAWGAGFLSVLFILNRTGVRQTAPYVLAGAALWICVLKSGVHATLAGVLVATLVPLRTEDGDSPLRRMEHGLHPWVAFGILPLFGFANAGVSLVGVGFSSLAEPVTLGIAAGLFLGKQVGVFGFAWGAVKLGLARLPKGVGWAQLYGVAVLCGVGFTMSLFIGSLAFEHSSFDAPVRLGVMVGSLVSAGVGYAILRLAVPVTREAPSVGFSEPGE